MGGDIGDETDVGFDAGFGLPVKDKLDEGAEGGHAVAVNGIGCGRGI